MNSVRFFLHVPGEVPAAEDPSSLACCPRGLHRSAGATLVGYARHLRLQRGIDVWRSQGRLCASGGPQENKPHTQSCGSDGESRSHHVENTGIYSPVYPVSWYIIYYLNHDIIYIYISLSLLINSSDS